MSRNIDIIIMPPTLSILSTPVQEEEDDDTKNNALPPSTPSPQAVDEFETTTTTTTTAVASADRSDLVSRMMVSDHLVTVNDDEVIESSYAVSLPELDGGETIPTTPGRNGDDDDDDDDTNSVNDITNYANNAPLTPNTLSYNSPLQFDGIRRAQPRYHRTTTTIPPIRRIQHKMLYQSLSSLATPPVLHAEEDDDEANNNNNDDDDANHDLEDRDDDRLHVGPERAIRFHTESLGIKLSRRTDGYVRVLSVTPYRAATSSTSTSTSRDIERETIREGEIREGDVVREVGDVNLRVPIDSAVWKLTVGLIRMAPRPLEFVVAEELLQFAVREDDEEEEENNDAVGNTPQDENNRTKADRAMQQRHQHHHQYHRQLQPQISDVQRFGPTRTIHFFDSSLGVKLHHNSRGYVQILSVVAPHCESHPDSPRRKVVASRRTGVMKGGDVVLEVGGVWDLRHPIEDDSWGVLVRFIRETRRPLSMVVADGDCLGYALFEDEVEEEEEEEHRRWRQQQGDESDASGGYSDDDDDEIHHGTRKVGDIIKVMDGSDDSGSESSDQEESAEAKNT